MSAPTFDVAILGAGFAGSLLAIIARRLGLSVTLLERGRHPRFAIGESSTPLADLQLASLAARYDLPWLVPLTQYGSWKRTYPQLACGLKRGFSFFNHVAGREFTAPPDHANELLVGANPNDEHGDTHWFRADFDAFLVERAVEAGAHYVDRFAVERIEPRQPWQIDGRSPDGAVTIRADFLTDATGQKSCLAEVLAVPSATDGMRTHSRAVYGHFRHVRRWAEVLAALGVDQRDHPFPCDAAALHHVFDSGWMWVLRFDNGVTSAGFSLDPQRHPLQAGSSAEQKWSELLAMFPSIGAQFAEALAVRPLVQTGRLQRLLSQSAGEAWACLPHAAGFVDPWLSPGIAHTLFAVERLAGTLAATRNPADRRAAMAEYNRALAREFEVIDGITAGCFRRFGRFTDATTTAMLYFAAAIYSEDRFRKGLRGADDCFLMAHDEDFRTTVAEVAGASGDLGTAMRDRVRRAIAPYNLAGLADPSRQNMYPFVKL